MNVNNPALTRGFEGIRGDRYSNSMTIGSTLLKTMLLLIVLLISTVLAYSKLNDLGSFSSTYLIISTIGTLILAIVTTMVPKIASITGVFYAIFEGVLLANTAFWANQYYPGIAMNAVLITIVVSMAMILVYMFNPSIGHRITKAVIGMTMAIALFYFLTFLLGLFGLNISYIYGNGIIGIAISIFVLIVAALNLIVDLDFLSKQCSYGAPKYMEWYSAFSMMITLIWIYVSVLNLLMKLASNDND